MTANPDHPLWEAKIEIAEDKAEGTNDILLELGNERWTLLEDAIARRAWIVGIFESDDAARSAWSELSLRIDVPLTKIIEIHKLAPHEWRDSYKTHFHAWKFGRLHWVPIWERDVYHVPETDTVLWLDPGMAFGTGNHETTRLCVERLVERASNTMPLGRVLDVGCGSGILALSAAKLGFAKVEGFDNDPEAVRVSMENAVLNGLETSVSFCVADLVSGAENKRADVVVANILANVLIDCVEELTSAVLPGGWLILSGILSSECESVKAAFAVVAPEWTQQSHTIGEWSDVLLCRPQ
jgi:ribosomal protein L11 methyltransferase